MDDGPPRCYGVGGGAGGGGDEHAVGLDHGHEAPVGVAFDVGEVGGGASVYDHFVEDLGVVGSKLVNLLLN